MDQTSFFRIDNLSVAIQDHRHAPVIRAVNNFSISINHGSVLGIVGESGSGKTVTALAMMGLLKDNTQITNGSIYYDGVDLLSLKSKERKAYYGKHMGMIFQEPMTSLNPLMKIGRQIEENAQIHLNLKGPALKELALLKMAQVGLHDTKRLYNAYPHELSGGMRQRAMIAAGIICEPSLLIADEPTTALDVTIQAQILKLLKKLVHEQQMSMIFISHDFSVISQMSDFVGVLYKGFLVEYGRCKELIADPLHPYTKALIRSIPRKETKGQKLYHMRQDSGHMLRDFRQCPYSDSCDKADETCLNQLPQLLPYKEGVRTVRCFKV